MEVIRSFCVKCFHFLDVLGLSKIHPKSYNPLRTLLVSDVSPEGVSVGIGIADP